MIAAAGGRSLGRLLLFLFLTVGGGGLTGLMVETGGWYAGLVKPDFDPPDWLFAPVWTALYVLIAIAGWQVSTRGDRVTQGLWWTQLALNFAWPPVFFAAQRLDLGLAVIVALLAAVAGFVVRTAGAGDRVPAMLFLPYALWTAYAGLLNGALWWLN